VKAFPWRCALALAFLSTAYAHGEQGWDTTRPRGHTREIDFTTSEGTLQALDISPDGQWIVFDLLAHVYRVRASGGRAECLTQGSGIALNYDPRYSPDGRQIAFVSDRSGQNSLWVMQADGASPRLVAEGGEHWLVQPAWSADGRALIATNYLIHRLSSQDWTVSSQLWRYPLDGSPPGRLTGAGLDYVVAPALSPDGRHVYYEKMDQPRSTEDYFLISGSHHLRRLELESGADEAVTESPAPRPHAYAAAPQVSPDGRTLSFVRRMPLEHTTYRGRDSAHASGLWLRDLASGRERKLVSPVMPDHFDTSDGYHLRFSPGYAWARDGRSIVYTEGGGIRRVDVGTGEVASIPFEARVRRTISQMARPRLHIDDGAFDVRFMKHPVSAPDGRTLLFQAVGRIWTMRYPSGTPRPLIAEEGAAFQYTPAWSPDGKWIAYTTWDDAAGGHVWKVRADGGAPVRLSRSSGEYLNPVWSPDGGQIYLLRGMGASFRGLTVRDNSHFRIVRMSAGGETASEVASDIATVRGIVRMSFGAGGSLYYTEESGSYDSAGEGHDWDEYQPRFALVSRDAEGGGRREHAHFPFARHAAPSPDGRRVVIQEAHNLLIAPLPDSPGSPPFLDRSDPSSPLEWLTRSGGLDAHWIDARTLEYIDGHHYHRYDVDNRRTTSTEIRLRVPRYEPRGKLAFTGARILTMKDRRVLEAATLVIEGSRIACVGVCDTKGVDRLIDAGGKTIIPGLFDAHAHPTWDGEIHRQHHPRLAIYPAYGVTTVFDPSADAGGVFPSADLIAAGRLVGPRVFTTGPALVSTGGIRPIRSYQDAEDDVTRLSDWGAISIKQYTQRRRDQRQWLVEAARRTGTVGVTGERLNLYYDLGMIMDGQSGWEHPITEHPTYADVARFVAASGTNHTPAMQTAGQGLEASEYWQARTGMSRDAKFLRWTPWREIPQFSDHVRRPLAEYPIIYWTETAKDVLRAGGSVSAGAHSKWDGVGAHREVWTFATALTPMEALETATVNPARYLGLDRDLGTLEPGKLADLVVLHSNPLDDIRNTVDIAYVAQGGVLFDDETLDRLWPDPAPYGPRPWLTAPSVVGPRQ
jgi:Tol biopolymer transport system component